MTLLWNSEGSAYEAAIRTSDGKADRLLGMGDTVPTDLHSHFAERSNELRKSLQEISADFEALLDKRGIGADELLCLGKTAHEQAEDADALLGLLVKCKSPDAIIQEAEATFDRLRNLEEQISEALEWGKGMGRRLMVLGYSGESPQSIR